MVNNDGFERSHKIFMKNSANITNLKLVAYRPFIKDVFMKENVPSRKY